MTTAVDPHCDPWNEDSSDETETSEPTPATLTGPERGSLMTPPSQDPDSEVELTTNAHAPAGFQSTLKEGQPKPTHSLLIIEDEAWDAKLLEAMLQGSLPMPVAFTHARTLEDAIQEIHAQRIQLVLTDLQLPDSAATETLPRLREAAPDVPVIVLSGYSDETLRAEALQAGALKYLVKGDVKNHAILTEIISQLDALPDLADDS